MSGVPNWNNSTMKILLIDSDTVGLNFALRCQWAGHVVRVWQPRSMGTGERCDIGDGMIEKVGDWNIHLSWADLIIVTTNSRYAAELEPLYEQGYPIVGTNKASAELELDRAIGQDVLGECGIETLDFEEFSEYDKAIEFVKRAKKVYVSKPWGGSSDKSLSYVPKSNEDLVCRLERWQKEGVKGKFILQEKIDGTEMAAGTWFGPGGFSKAINETWEEKRFMNDGYGPNTGEMGTVLRYTKHSKLFDQVVKPLESKLHELGFVGNVDVSCMIDRSGRPWPMEFTMRFGWPAFNLMLALHEGDPAEWLADLLVGRDSLEVSNELCCGVLMTLGDYPWEKWPHHKVEGWPIRGLTAEVLGNVALTSAKLGKAPTMVGSEIRDVEGVVTAGEYVLVAYGKGATVEASRKAAYKIVDQISWPPHANVRTDIGKRLEQGLKELHRHGYATDVNYGN